MDNCTPLSDKTSQLSFLTTNNTNNSNCSLQYIAAGYNSPSVNVNNNKTHSNIKEAASNGSFTSIVQTSSVCDSNTENKSEQWVNSPELHIKTLPKNSKYESEETSEVSLNIVRTEQKKAFFERATQGFGGRSGLGMTVRTRCCMCWAGNIREIGKRLPRS